MKSSEMVKKIRFYLNVSQCEFADALGVSLQLSTVGKKDIVSHLKSQ